ncbi:MAG TPA: hypothetical protein VGK58_12375 [Lacipirellulaceae bacterium]
MTIYDCCSPTRKKPRVEWWLGSLVVLFPALAMFQQGAPPIILSRETTFVTEPLKADGLPDYEKYALAVYRANIVPENNAAVLLWTAMWPGEIEPADYSRFCRELGLVEVPDAATACQPLYGDDNRRHVLKWLHSRGNANATQDTVGAVLDEATTRPWKIQSLPPLADWVRKNRSALDAIVAASHRPQFYSPSPSLLNEVDEPLVEMLMPGAQMARSAARSLSVRAMSYLGEGHINRAWQDILACHRLARLLPTGTLIEYLVAIGIDEKASDSTVALLSDPRISPEQARPVLRDIQSLSEFTTIADSYDELERIVYLDSVLALRGRRARAWQELFELDDEFFNVTKLPADWNVALRQGNELYDRMAATARMPSSRARDAAISRIIADIEKLGDDAKRRLPSIAVLNPQARGEVFAALTIALMVPAFDASLTAQDRVNTKLHLTRLAAAIAVYRAEHGTYPAKLDDLAPSVLLRVPVDLHNRRFGYRQKSDGYLLYTRGKNGADDHGSHEQYQVLNGEQLDTLNEAQAEARQAQIPKGADDISILVPRPAFELPKLQAIPQ